jgi:hypothetical protein
VDAGGGAYYRTDLEGIGIGLVSTNLEKPSVKKL